ncbi:endonuclease-reverse transcriptase domain-containing protein [Hirsutella rhossiliensis]
MHHRHPNNRSDRRSLRVFQANVGKILRRMTLRSRWLIRSDTTLSCCRNHGQDLKTADASPRRIRPTTHSHPSPTGTAATLVRESRHTSGAPQASSLIKETCGDSRTTTRLWKYCLAGRQEHRGEDIAFWAMDNRLSLLNAVDVPTNARGSTIDLAFSNIPLADAVVEDHLATGSDHFTLSIMLPSQALTPLPLCKIRLNSDEELKRFVELVEAGAAFIPTTTSTPSELDNFASALVDLLGCAARLRADRPCQAPPLQVDGRVYETQLEKATALRRATLERRTASDDIPDPWIPVNTDKMIPFPNQVSFEEARDATLRTGNTSPGSDNITVRMLRAVWHAIGSLVHQLASSGSLHGV